MRTDRRSSALEEEGSVFGGDVAFTVVEELGVASRLGGRTSTREGRRADHAVDERLERLWSPASRRAREVRAGVDEVAPFTDKFNASARGGGIPLASGSPFCTVIRSKRGHGHDRTVCRRRDHRERRARRRARHPTAAAAKSSPEVMLRYHADRRRSTRAARWSPSVRGRRHVRAVVLHRRAEQTDGDRRVLLLTFHPRSATARRLRYEPALLASSGWTSSVTKLGTSSRSFGVG